MKDTYGTPITLDRNWEHDFRGWDLSKDGTYYICNEAGHPYFKNGEKYVVLCHGMSNFEVLPLSEVEKLKEGE